MWARSKAGLQGLAAADLEARPRGIGSEEGPQAFAYALETGLPQVIVSPFDFAGRVERAAQISAVSTEAVSAAPTQNQARHERPNIMTPFVAPRDDVEQCLAGIWQEVLGIAQVGIHDSFFDLGGDSILGMRVVARVRKEGLQLQPAQLFEYSTIAELAPIVGAVQPPTPAPATSRARQSKFDERQLGLILTQLDPGAKR